MGCDRERGDERVEADGRLKWVQGWGSVTTGL